MSRGVTPMQCPNCLHMLREGAKFCDSCGARLSEPALTVNQIAGEVDGELRGINIGDVHDLPSGTHVSQKILHVGSGGRVEGASIGKTESSRVDILNSSILNQLEAVGMANTQRLGQNDIRNEIVEISEEIERIQQEIDNGTIPDTQTLTHKLKKMSPDILDVIVTTLANPLLGIYEVIRKVAVKAKEEAQAAEHNNEGDAK